MKVNLLENIVSWTNILWMNRRLIAKNNKCFLIFLLLPPRLLQYGGVAAADAHHQVAEGTVDVLAAALQRRVVGRVNQVHRQLPRLCKTRSQPWLKLGDAGKIDGSMVAEIRVVRPRLKFDLSDVS